MQDANVPQTSCYSHDVFACATQVCIPLMSAKTDDWDDTQASRYASMQSLQSAAACKCHVYSHAKASSTDGKANKPAMMQGQ